MQQHGNVPVALDGGDSADVIEMRMREPDRFDRPAGRAHHATDARRLVAGIDQHGRARDVAQQVAVFPKWAHRHPLDAHAV